MLLFAQVYYSLPVRAQLIKAVTFDVGGTLIRPWPSVGHIYAQIAERHGYGQISVEKLNANFAAAWRNKDDFRHSREQWRRLVNDTFAGLLPGAPHTAFFDELYAFFAKAQAWRVFDDVRPTLDELRARGFKLGIISNWDERLRPLMSELRLAEYFDAVAISVEQDSTKPDSKIFHSCLENLGFPAHCVLHVGDSHREDGLGAQSAGMATLLLEREGRVAHRNTIRSLTAVFDLLDK